MFRDHRINPTALVRGAAFSAALVGGAAALTACDDRTEAPPVIHEVRTSYSWTGLAGGSGYNYSITCEPGGQCHARVECTGRHVRSSPAETSTSEATVADEMIQALASIVDDARPATEPSEVIEHTDDYPKFDITLVTDKGELKVSSTSNTDGYIPWNLLRDGRQYVNTSDAFPQALAAVNDGILPERCLN